MGQRINVLDLRVATGSGGGPEKTILLGAEKADTSRFNVMVAYMRNADDAEFTIAQRAREKGLTFFDLLERSPFDPQMLRQLVSILRTQKVDILHAHDYKSDVLGVLLRPFLRFKMVTTVHGWGVTQDRKMLFYRRIDQRSLRFYQRVMAVSQDLADAIVRCGVPAQRVVCVHNGIDTEHFQRRGDGTLRDELHLPSNAPLVGAIGRLNHEKDLTTFLRAARLISEQRPDARFVLVGEGEERADLEQLTATLGLSGKVFFLGQRSDIRNVYRSLDLLMLTSLHEGMPNVVLEAMAMEVPVVATNVGGVGEIVTHDVNGLLCPSQNPASLAHAALSVLNNPDVAERLREAARQRICQHFSFTERVRKVERIYLEVMGSPMTND
jgi:glycosyltransferase involved in cell wall biosynthesis